MREAADYLRVSYKRFCSNYALWKIPCVRIGGRVKFRQRHLDEFIERCTEDNQGRTA
jgi:hypothetical protein